MDTNQLTKNYSITKLQHPLDVLTHNGVRLLGVTEIGRSKQLGIMYVIGEIMHLEKEQSYTILQLSETN